MSVKYLFLGVGETEMGQNLPISRQLHSRQWMHELGDK